MKDPRSVTIYGMAIQMIHVSECMPPEDDSEIGSKHVVDKNTNTISIRKFVDGIVTCRRVCVTQMTGTTSDDWIYWHSGYDLTLLQSVQRYR
jgi:hypothetical protein